MNRPDRYLPLFLLALPTAAHGGMPAPLPTDLTKDSYPHWQGLSPWIDERLQAISFFVVLILFSAAIVGWLWNFARRDWPQLPSLTYRRSLAFTLIWGLVALIILTMISGARELMTPGAWRKQGWTYKLTSAESAEPHFRSQRRASLEQLRLAILQYATMNRGHYPATKAELTADWNIPTHPGFEWIYRTGTSPTSNGELLVFEPELGDRERFVLLSNGMLGTMRAEEISAIVK